MHLYLKLSLPLFLLNWLSIFGPIWMNRGHKLFKLFVRYYLGPRLWSVLWWKTPRHPWVSALIIVIIWIMINKWNISSYYRPPLSTNLVLILGFPITSLKHVLLIIDSLIRVVFNAWVITDVPDLFKLVPRLYLQFLVL